MSQRQQLKRMIEIDRQIRARMYPNAGSLAKTLEAGRRVILRPTTMVTGGEMIYYAHTKTDDEANWQTIKEHLLGTAELTKQLGNHNKAAQLAYIAALLHDIGKYSAKFQQRLRGGAIRVDHASAGAKEAIRLFNASPTKKIMANLLAYCIVGHHGGLPNGGSKIDVESETTLSARLKRAVEPYQHYPEEIDLKHLALPDHLMLRLIQENPAFSLSFLTRMIYSILVDADFQDTETFVNGEKKPRGEYDDLAVLASRFGQFLTRFDHPEGAINQQRTTTLKACLARAVDSPGMFTLTLPTGGGKTYASMGFALKHAIFHGMKRIIYVIPYTSIIEQNAAEFKKILGDDAILEHHSNFDFDQSSPETEDDFNRPSRLTKLKLAAENWDIPVIVTTNVQFFESLFANRSSRCRKIHNLANSVIVFDEAQILPREYLKPCLYAVSELVNNYGVSAVFCTATQPCIEQFLPKGNSLKELIPDPQGQFEFYKRVHVVKRGQLADEDLLIEINQQNQVLCIVNTRKHARGLFQGLQGEGNYHLSTLMCAAHRTKVIEEIRARLKKGKACRVISTQLLEAGVDLDFPVGYRALAGLESIIQAAGRVNREGEQTSADLYAFEPVSTFVKRIPRYIEQGAEVARQLLNRFDNPISIEAIQCYYRELYILQDSNIFDNKNILKDFSIGREFPRFDFKTVADKFRLIENDTMPVIIPWNDEAINLLAGLETADFPMKLIRRLQPYIVNIFKPEYEALLMSGALDVIQDTFAMLRKEENLYDSRTGLVIPESQRGQAIFVDDF